MASFKTKEIPIPSPLAIFYFVQLYMLFFLTPSAKSTSFSFPSFGANLYNITLQGDASATPGRIVLTKSQVNEAQYGSVGRALYAYPVRLWDKATDQVADFTTHFSFVIQKQAESMGADGLAFFLAPNGSEIAGGGAYLGVLRDPTSVNAPKEYPVVAIEFDTYSNWQWDPPRDHIGIDINSVKSVATLMGDLRVDNTANVWVSYNSSSKNLSVYLTYDQDPRFNGESILSCLVDLKEKLPEWIDVGFSATTGTAFELHSLLSWEFNSTEPSPPPPPPPASASDASSSDTIHGLISAFGLYSSCIVFFHGLIFALG